MNKLDVNFILSGYYVFLEKFEFRSAIQVRVREFEADLLRDELVHDCRFESIRILAHQTEKSCSYLGHLFIAVLDSWVSHMLVTTYVLR